MRREGGEERVRRGGVYVHGGMHVLTLACQHFPVAFS